MSKEKFTIVHKHQKKTYTWGLFMLCLSLSLQHTWAQCVESEWKPRTSHGLSGAHRRICPKRPIYVCICIYMQTDLYAIYAVFPHKHTHTPEHSVEKANGSLEQVTRYQLLTTKYIIRDLYIHIYMYIYTCGNRPTHEAYWCCFFTRTHKHIPVHTHTHTHTHTHLEHSVEKANVSIKRVTGYLLLTAKYVKRESYKWPIYAVSLHTHLSTVCRKRTAASSESRVINCSLASTQSSSKNWIPGSNTHWNTYIRAYITRRVGSTWLYQSLNYRSLNLKEAWIPSRMCYPGTVVPESNVNCGTYMSRHQTIRKQTCRYKRVPVMLSDLFCDVLHTTSCPRDECTCIHTYVGHICTCIHTYTHVFICIYVCLWACMNA